MSGQIFISVGAEDKSETHRLRKTWPANPQASKT